MFKKFSILFVSVAIMCCMSVNVFAAELQKWCGRFLYTAGAWDSMSIYLPDFEKGKGSVSGRCVSFLSKEPHQGVLIEFTSETVKREWERYHREFICVRGRIETSSFGEYMMYNPKFLNYCE